MKFLFLPNMLTLANLNLFSVISAIILSGALGLIVYLKNSRSATHKAFFLFSIFSIFWNISNYLSYQFSTLKLVLWFARINVFFAVWYVFAIFQLIFIFPRDEMSFSKKYKFILLPLIIFVSILTFTPTVFSHIEEFSIEEGRLKVVNGPFIILFGLTVISLIGSGIFLLIRRAAKAIRIEKIQYHFLLGGIIITFSLHIVFNFIFPAFLNNPRFIPLGGIFSFPFFILTAYAIFKHHLFNIKVISTEIFVILLSLIFLVKFLFSQNLSEIVLNGLFFVAVSVVGGLLIKSVLTEVRIKDKLKEQNIQLQELLKLKSEFLTVASHQLRTPTSIIKGMLSMILEGSVTGALREEYIQKSFITAMRLERIIQDLLTASELEGSKIDLKLEPLEIENLIEELLKEKISLIGNKKVDLHFEKPKSKLPLLLLDSTRIKEALSNLIDNAIFYTKAGHIEVSAAQKDNQVEIKIKDTGIGITEEDKARLFKKFSRGAEALRTHPNGSGLGLFIVQKFVGAHRGKVAFESPGKDQGSTFTITLPLNLKFD